MYVSHAHMTHTLKHTINMCRNNWGYFCSSSINPKVYHLRILLWDIACTDTGSRDNIMSTMFNKSKIWILSLMSTKTSIIDLNQRTDQNISNFLFWPVISLRYVLLRSCAQWIHEFNCLHWIYCAQFDIYGVMALPVGFLQHHCVPGSHKVLRFVSRVGQHFHRKV